MKTDGSLCRKNALAALKKHYLAYVLICLIAAMIGSDFLFSLQTIPQVTRSIRHIGWDFGWIRENADEESREEADINIAIERLKSGDFQGISGLFRGHEEKRLEYIKALEDGFKDVLEVFGIRLEKEKGYLAWVVLNLQPEMISALIQRTLTRWFKSAETAAVLRIIFFAVVIALLLFFFVGVARVAFRRLFLEGRTYENLPVSRILFLFRHRKWFHIAVTIFIVTLWEALWWLTIIGGVIKHLEYLQVPFLLAENPELKAGEAVKLSKEMMKGRKLEVIGFEFRIIGWRILGYVTWGILNALYVNPYRATVYTEYYVFLRKCYLEEHPDCVELQADPVLYRIPEEKEIREAYKEGFAAFAACEETRRNSKGLIGFLARNFGVAIEYGEQEKRWAKEQVEYMRYREHRSAMERKAYPEFLNRMKFYPAKRLVYINNYLEQYHVWSLAMLFFFCSIFGWGWEVVEHYTRLGTWVNRGFLHGPWVPIYGGAAMMILCLLFRFRKNVLAELGLTIVIAGVVEYLTSMALSAANNGKMWWDYRGCYLNMNGRISAEGLIAFAVLGFTLVYLVGPLLNKLFRLIPWKIGAVVSLSLFGIFFIDVAYSVQHPNSGDGITAPRIDDTFENNSEKESRVEEEYSTVISAESQKEETI